MSAYDPKRVMTHTIAARSACDRSQRSVKMLQFLSLQRIRGLQNDHSMLGVAHDGLALDGVVERKSPSFDSAITGRVAVLAPFHKSLKLEDTKGK